MSETAAPNSTTPPPAGVHLDSASGKWTWYCPETKTQGPVVGSRAEARTAYQAHRKSAGLVGAAKPQEPAATPTEETQPVATKTKAAKKSAGKKSGAKRKSGAVAKVWEIAGKIGKDRAKVLEACAAAGINPNTAKTQYQRWLHRNDK